MTTTEDALQARLAAQGSPLLMRRWLDPMFEPYEHTVLLSRICRDAIIDPDACKRLLIAVTTRVGKTMVVSQALPLFFLHLFPHKHVILASHSDKLAKRNARWVRNMIMANREVLNVEVSPDSRAVDDWQTTAGGGLRAVGLQSAVSGFGADLAIVDDPHAGWEDSHSPAMQEQVWDWFTAELRMRLHPGGTIIVVSNRWAEGDLMGRIIEAEEQGQGEHYEYVRIPTIADHDPDDGEVDPLGREVGQVGFVDMWPEAEMRQRVLAAGSEARRAAIFQQDPRKTDGNSFDRYKWQFWDQDTPPPRSEFIAFCRFWDLAATEGGGDYTAGVLLGRHRDGRTFVLDVIREQFGPTKVKNLLRDTIEDDRRTWGHRLATRFERESGSGGVSWAEDLMEDVFKPYRNVESVPAGGGAGKQARAWPWSAHQGAGKAVLCPTRSNEHYDAYVDEHAVFPGRYDDMVDASAGAFSCLVSIARRTKTTRHISPAKRQLVEYAVGR